MIWPYRRQMVTYAQWKRAITGAINYSSARQCSSRAIDISKRHRINNVMLVPFVDSVEKLFIAASLLLFFWAVARKLVTFPSPCGEMRAASVCPEPLRWCFSSKRIAWVRRICSSAHFACKCRKIQRGIETNLLSCASQWPIKLKIQPGWNSWLTCCIKSESRKPNTKANDMVHHIIWRRKNHAR